MKQSKIFVLPPDTTGDLLVHTLVMIVQLLCAAVHVSFLFFCFIISPLSFYFFWSQKHERKPRNSYGQERRENETQADYLHGLTHKTIELSEMIL